jgi:hypothetical protein
MIPGWAVRSKSKSVVSISTQMRNVKKVTGVHISLDTYADT